MEIVPIPFDAIAGAAALLAVLVGGITQVSKKLGACDAHVVIVAIVSSQALSVGWTVANGKATPVGLYLAVVVGIAATLIAMGYWQAQKSKTPSQ